VYDSPVNTNAASQRLSVTRLDFLVSDFSLRRTDGIWFASSNRFTYISGREGRLSFDFAGAPDAQYDRVRFNIGAPAEENHKDPAGRAPSDPLNPIVNGLHWGWQGGYVFFALEGHWLDDAGKESGYSYHIATDPMLTTVDLPADISAATNREIRIALNLDRVFAAKHHIVISDDTSSTHSRTNDPLASRLRDNIGASFAIAGVGTSVPETASTPPKAVDIASGATPFRLTISKFFPKPALPIDNPLTEQGVELGRRLFEEKRLSINNRQSCASCHQATAAYVDAGKRVSAGAEGALGTRNAMPLFNLAWKSAFFWDGRAALLREQVLMPIQNPIEMHESLTNVVAKLSATHPSNGAAGSGVSNYPKLFAAAFETPEVTVSRIARALEQFLLTQVAYTSKFDRAINGEIELTTDEKRGFELFNTEYDPVHGQHGADCFHCHGGPFFQSQTFANNGLDSVFADAGRQAVTHKEGDRGKFAVPSLRNVAVTGPYMHDGRFQTLEEVIEHYSSGVKRSATLDPNIAKHPDGGVPLSPSDKQALAAFLRTLTDERFLPKSTDVAAKD
jgi:cytochrome c peroxidase